MNYQRIHDKIIADSRLSSPVGFKHRNKTMGYKEKHHIIPRCMGGTNDPENLIYLTARRHFIIHRLLTKIYPNEPKLWYAFNMMFNETNKKMRFNDAGWVKSKSVSHTYEYFRRQRPPVSDATKQKLRLAGMGRQVSKTTRQKHRLQGTGRTNTQETKEKMRLAAIERWNNPGRRLKQSEKAKLRWSIPGAKEFQSYRLKLIYSSGSSSS